MQLQGQQNTQYATLRGDEQEYAKSGKQFSMVE
jgi:hypothetical protein